ncbi:unnamed protein product [Alternaria sp. RS040]
MSLPLANSTPNGSILNLPDELLLLIAKHLLLEPRFNQCAYWNLLPLATVNTRFPRIVRSILQEQKALYVPLPNVHALFRTLREFPAAQWADKIESLEITNYPCHEASWEHYVGDNDGCMRMPERNQRERLIQHLVYTGEMTREDGRDYSKMPARQFSIEIDTSFRTDCLDAIREADGVSNNNKWVWKDALRAGHNNAFLALLLLILPNLKALLLGGSHTFHFPMVFRDADPRQGPMSPKVNDRIHWSRDPSTRLLREHKYLAQVFHKSYSRLTELELPASWHGIGYREMSRLSPRFLGFDNLQKLILPEVALPIDCIVRTNGLVYSSFPKSLRSLTTVHSGWVATDYVREMIYDPATDLATHLPKLRAISVYWNTYNTEERYGFDPEDYARATELGIELFGHAPQYEWTAVAVGGQPWKLSENELDDMAGLSLRDRTVRRRIAGHWIGEKQAKDYSFSSAKMHFRKLRG